MQMRVADFLVKPVAAIDLVRACARVAQKRPPAPSRRKRRSTPSCPRSAAPASPRWRCRRRCSCSTAAARACKPSTCLVDLDFQHGTVADYLDLEPRLNLAEIEPRPDRLDRQLLEVMLSYHASGLAVVAAPNRPAEMRSFDPDVVTRLLDLVSTNFDYVVFDMPRTWFSWTDSVLLGSNKLFIVSETTVPGLRHAKQLVAAIKERLGDGPQSAGHRQPLPADACSRPACGSSDLQQTLGDAFAAVDPQRLRAGARGDRPRRAARRGQARQQDHAPN